MYILYIYKSIKRRRKICQTNSVCVSGSYICTYLYIHMCIHEKNKTELMGLGASIFKHWKL